MELLENLKMLVNLAMIDGSMAEQEKEYIRNIARANKFPESAAETLFYSTHNVILPQHLSVDQKFDFMISLIQMMKIDERLYPDEIKFCINIIKKLGYRQEVAADLLLKVGKDPLPQEQLDELKTLVSGYLANE